MNMVMNFRFAAFLSIGAVALASCGANAAGDSSAANSPIVTRPSSEAKASDVFAIEEKGSFAEPWAMAFEPGTGNLLITEKKGTLKLRRANGTVIVVSGAPGDVSYGGQGGFADVAFAPDYPRTHTIYLSWVTQDESRKRFGVVGRGRLFCSASDCAIDGLEVIWRQAPALQTFGQFALRLAFSPDAKYLFVASGDLARGTPAQDTTNNLGSIVRLNLDGTPAAGNPLADQPGAAADVWSWGHRNQLGLKFDPAGRLWDVEHGPAGGDELNLVEPGKNYGWPLVSNGDDYSGTPIPRHATRPDLAAPALSWNPVIAPGDFIFCSGALFPQWRGQALIAGLKTQTIVRVSFNGVRPSEATRYSMGARIREIAEGPDGAIWVLTDGNDGRLLRLTPKA
jgi:glucose/arabinose dehydrogenase